MITINPAIINKIKPISFGEGNLNNLTPNVGILSLQNPNAKVNFEKDLFLTQKADTVQSNPLTALGYKFVKTYNILFPHSEDKCCPKPQGLSYLA